MNIQYVAFLRGINIGSHRVKMEYLRKLCTDAGCKNVRSYIQTGNIFFESEEANTIVIREKLENHLESTLGYHVPVCLRTIEELENIINLQPFKQISLTPDTRFAITFLAEKIDEKLPIPSITSDGGYELIGMTDSELFVVWHLKDGRTSNSYGFEKNVKVDSTTRFWHTTEKILAAAKK